MIIQGVSYLSDFEAKKAIIAAASKLYQRGWMIAGDGSLSVKVGPNAIWISIAGADKANLTQDQLVRIDLNGRQASTNKPKPLGDDIETQLRIYKENERVRSIIHAYPVNVISLSSKGKGAEAAVYTPAIRKLGRIALADALKTEQAISDVVLLSKNDNGVILKGDGCMMWGATPQEAADYIELLDYYCEASRSLQGCGEGSCSCKSAKTAPQSQTEALTENILPKLGFASLMQFIPKCTADCKLCANQLCMQRRQTGFIATASVKAACTADCSSCGNMSCSERREQTAAQLSLGQAACSKNCSSCGNMSCSLRKDTGIAADNAEVLGLMQHGQGADKQATLAAAAVPIDCSHDCELCQYESCADREPQSEAFVHRLLPSGMTGIIRPGESLPPLPDETAPAIKAEDTAPSAAFAATATPNGGIDAKHIKPQSDASRQTGAGPKTVSSSQTDADHMSSDKHQVIDKKQLMSGIVKHYIGS